MNESEDPSEFLRKLQATAVSVNTETSPMAAAILLNYTECLVENPLNILAEERDPIDGMRDIKD